MTPGLSGEIEAARAAGAALRESAGEVASYDLRLGRYQDVLADVEVDAVICDPPYSERTHDGYRSGSDSSDAYGRAQVNYTAINPDRPLTREELDELARIAPDFDRGVGIPWRDSSLVAALDDVLDAMRYLVAGVDDFSTTAREQWTRLWFDKQLDCVPRHCECGDLSVIHEWTQIYDRLERRCMCGGLVDVIPLESSRAAFR